MKYMIDTNICIYIIKQKPIHLIHTFQTFSAEDIGISSITLAELEYGVAKSQHIERNKEALEQFLIPLEILAFDDLAAEAYGNIRVYLEKNGQPIGAMDLMIAAHAISLNLPLVTNNVREFERVPGLKVETWV